jgi:branched-chain amino acid transport system permease protein
MSLRLWRRFGLAPRLRVNLSKSGLSLSVLAAFVLSAAIAGLAGAVKAIVGQNASLTDVAFSTSGEVVLMTLVGGMGTLYGPVVGAIIVVAMQNYLAQSGEWVTVIQGIVFVACVLAFRRGIVGELAAWARISL